MSAGGKKKANRSRWLLGAQGMGSDSSATTVAQAGLQQKYGAPLSHGPGETNLHNQGCVLGIRHVPTNRYVEFSAFITDQSDAFTSTWNEETVFGRMDPIATFESTKRVSSLGFTVPAYSVEAAVENLARINTLISFLYPTFTDRGGPTGGGVSTVNMGPLVRVKYANIITNPDAPSRGLLGYITTGITVTPNLEAGVFLDTSGDTGTGTGVTGVEILYKAYDLNFELSVLHEHSLGFTSATVHNTKTFIFRNKKGAFPYNHNRHMPFTIHGTTDGISPPAPTSAQAGNSVGQPNSEQRRQFVRQFKNNATLNTRIKTILESRWQSQKPAGVSMKQAVTLTTASTAELAAAVTKATK